MNESDWPHPNQSNLDGTNPQLLHPSNPATGCMALCIRHVFEDTRNQWEVLADGVAIDLGLEVFAGGFHAGDLAKEGDFLFAVGQLGHAAFG